MKILAPKDEKLMSKFSTQIDYPCKAKTSLTAGLDGEGDPIYLIDGNEWSSAYFITEHDWAIDSVERMRNALIKIKEEEVEKAGGEEDYQGRIIASMYDENITTLRKLRFSILSEIRDEETIHKCSQGVNFHMHKHEDRVQKKIIATLPFIVKGVWGDEKAKEGAKKVVEFNLSTL